MSYFSEHDLMKKVNYGRLLKEQGKLDEALETLESIMFTEYGTLNVSGKYGTQKPPSEEFSAVPPA